MLMGGLIFGFGAVILVQGTAYLVSSPGVVGYTLLGLSMSKLAVPVSLPWRTTKVISAVLLTAVYAACVYVLVRTNYRAGVPAVLIVAAFDLGTIGWLSYRRRELLALVVWVVPIFDLFIVWNRITDGVGDDMSRLRMASMVVMSWIFTAVISAILLAGLGSFEDGSNPILFMAGLFGFLIVVLYFFGYWRLNPGTGPVF